MTIEYKLKKILILLPFHFIILSFFLCIDLEYYSCNIKKFLFEVPSKKLNNVDKSYYTTKNIANL